MFQEVDDVLALGQGHGASFAITGDGNAKEEGDRTEIANLERRTEDLLDVVGLLFGLRDDGDIIDKDRNDNLDARTRPDVDGWIRDSLVEASVLENFVETLVPKPTRLLETVETFAKTADPLDGVLDETFRLLHVYGFGECAMEIRTLNIHLVYFPVISSSEGEDGSYRCELGDWSESVSVVDTISLRIALGN